MTAIVKWMVFVTMPGFLTRMCLIIIFIHGVQVLCHCSVIFKLVFATVSLALRVVSVIFVKVSTTDSHQVDAGIV